ncbi:MAG: SH3 domain-containing protein [Anaerolineales bacterium]|nr:MAG: SH3 domain-containing protein [Anaerolineales bacterium]
MNKDELMARLEEQRKWRERRPSPAAAKPRHSLPIARLALAFFFVPGMLYAAWALAPNFSLQETSPASLETNMSVPLTSKATAANTEQTTITMTVCAGGFDAAKLHVRFEAGLKGDVRGYLAEGETVTVPLGERGEPLTKLIDDVRWTFIQSPIIGWVSASHLCK